MTPHPSSPQPPKNCMTGNDYGSDSFMSCFPSSTNKRDYIEYHIVISFWLFLYPTPLIHGFFFLINFNRLSSSWVSSLYLLSFPLSTYLTWYICHDCRLRAAGKANAEAKKARSRDRAARAMPAPEANAELQANLDVRLISCIFPVSSMLMFSNLKRWKCWVDV